LVCLCGFVVLRSPHYNSNFTAVGNLLEIQDHGTRQSAVHCFHLSFKSPQFVLVMGRPFPFDGNPELTRRHDKITLTGDFI
jgi:hypothetical protein